MVICVIFLIDNHHKWTNYCSKKNSHITLHLFIIALVTLRDGWRNILCHRVRLDPLKDTSLLAMFWQLLPYVELMWACELIIECQWNGNFIQIATSNAYNPFLSFPCMSLFLVFLSFIHTQSVWNSIRTLLSLVN